MQVAGRLEVERVPILSNCRLGWSVRLAMERSVHPCPSDLEQRTRVVFRDPERIVGFRIMTLREWNVSFCALTKTS